MDAARWITPQQISDPALLTPGLLLKLLWRHPSLRAMLWFRLGSWCKRHRIPLAAMIQQRITLVYGLEIKVGGDIGGGLYIAHPVGTVIYPEKIGENCTIIGSVTIGLRSEWKFPCIGDRVFIGVGARVLGGLQVGNDAEIGANAVVIHDVPAGATAVGIPAQVIRIDGRRVGGAGRPATGQEDAIETAGTYLDHESQMQGRDAHSN